MISSQNGFSPFKMICEFKQCKEMQTQGKIENDIRLAMDCRVGQVAGQNFILSGNNYLL